ncbi:hypothetical protein MKW94_001553 [Papaver nudicaule]|uniref:Glycosyltransferase n=1 Tax=Papaver nudicaule TaxID=74823 RepID=A0AA41VZ44_PAPNU|nr:hypothetical protein [Papaver nudicaule]
MYKKILSTVMPPSSTAASTETLPMKTTTDSSSPSGGSYTDMFRRRNLTITLLVGVVLGLPCLIYFNDMIPSQLLSLSFYDSNSIKVDARLKEVLEKAAMKDKTVILTTLNEAWATPNSVFDLFLESFRIGERTQNLTSNLVIIALDGKAYKRCMEIHPHCYALTTSGIDFSEEAYFMSADYLVMMWRRIDFLRTVLEMGYNFVFTDADIMWFRNPFDFNRFYNGSDFQIACDWYNGNSRDVNNSPNGGFTYVRSNERTKKFYKYWYEARQSHPGKHDQDVLNIIKHKRSFRNIGLKIRFLNTAYFGGLCQPSRNLNEVCTMHANCCFGLDNKLNDLNVMLNDWRRFMALSEDSKKSWKKSWNVPQNCSLGNFHPHPSKKDAKQEKIV